MPICDLIPKVVRGYEAIAPGKTLIDIYLFQVDVPRRDIANYGPPSQESELDGAGEVREYWPNPEQIDLGKIQILVSAEIVSTPPTQLRPDATTLVPQLTSAIERLTLRQETTAKAFRDAPSASAAADHSNFQHQQLKDDAPIYNGRPYDRTSVPIQLLHPVFNFFKARLEQTGELPATTYRAVDRFLFHSQGIHSSESLRWSAIKGYLTAAIGHQVHKDDISKCHSYGVVAFTEKGSAAKAYGVIIELKNEIGTGNSDPWIQGAQSFSRYWSQLGMTGLRGATCCPSFIISIAGPWMCISGAVYLDRVVVQPLTDYMWLGLHPQQDHYLLRMARIFEALDSSISFLKEYYSPFIKPDSPCPLDPGRFFPYVKSVQGAKGTINFKYNEALGAPNVVRPIYQATTEDGCPIVVKFAQFYNFEAHKLLEERSLAPKLLSLRAEPVGGGLVMIVMELSGTSLDNYVGPTGPGLESSGRDQILKDVKSALDLLHANKLVFGDLRPPNVLVVQAANGSLRGQLVDFEWCGLEGTARYPVGMNESRKIRWAAGVEKGSLLYKGHDNDMLEKLFSPPPAENLTP